MLTTLPAHRVRAPAIRTVLDAAIERHGHSSSTSPAVSAPVGVGVAGFQGGGRSRCRCSAAGGLARSRRALGCGGSWPQWNGARRRPPFSASRPAAGLSKAGGPLRVWHVRIGPTCGGGLGTLHTLHLDRHERANHPAWTGDSVRSCVISWPRDHYLHSFDVPISWDHLYALHHHPDDRCVVLHGATRRVAAFQRDSNSSRSFDDLLTRDARTCPL